MMREHVVDAIKASPVAGFIGSKVAGLIQWDTVSYILAGTYTAILIGEKLLKYY